MNENTNVSLQLWDVDGQAIEGKMLETYVHDANAIVFVYDITNKESFDAIEYWCKQVVLCSKKGEDAPTKILFGNKSDLGHLSAVTNEKQKSFAKKHGLDPYIGSAKTGDQLSQAFYKVAADLADIKVSTSQIEAQSIFKH